MGVHKLGVHILSLHRVLFLGTPEANCFLVSTSPTQTEKQSRHAGWGEGHSESRREQEGARRSQALPPRGSSLYYHLPWMLFPGWPRTHLLQQRALLLSTYASLRMTSGLLSSWTKISPQLTLAIVSSANNYHNPGHLKNSFSG